MEPEPEEAALYQAAADNQAAAYQAAAEAAQQAMPRQSEHGIYGIRGVGIN